MKVKRLLCITGHELFDNSGTVQKQASLWIDHGSVNITAYLTPPTQLILT